jgi:polar amino acid transport system permease protein
MAAVLGLAPALTAAPVPAYDFDFSVIWPSLPLLLQGLVLTIEISVIVILISTLLGFPLAVARMSKHEIIRWPAQAYIEVFRCTPMLVQLLWVFYALPAVLGITIPAVPSVCIALTANLTAFTAEVYRAGMQSIPVEQLEAAEMLRLSRYQILRSIVVPQAFRQQIPTILSLDISLFKDTSLVSALGVAELTFQGNILASQTYRPLEVFTTVALIYFIIAFPLTLVTSAVERRIIRSNSIGAPPPGSRGLRRLLPGGRPPIAVPPTSVGLNARGAAA